MHIVFNSLIAGLSNNGGSRTIFLSAKVLRSLGHKVYVCARVDNLTWFAHEPTLSYIPDNADVIINSSCNDMESTLSSKIKKKYWYIRGHETWSMPESKLVEYYLNSEVKNIVNSIGLQKQLESYGAKSEVVYQGVDFNDWRDLRIRDNNYKTRIGCLYNKKPSKKWQDFVKLANILGHDNFEYVAFGNEVCNYNFLVDFKHRPCRHILNELYSSCDIWIAPTISEGLHNVGIESSLSGALLICNDNLLNGMICDYASKDTALIYQDGNIQQAANLIKSNYRDYDRIENMQEVIKNNINTREYNMKKLINILETSYVN